jgi:large subunit ribosomal protein L6
MNFFLPFRVTLKPSLRACFVEAPVANISLPFHGTDLAFLSTSVFFRSKASVVQFTQLFNKLARTAVVGYFVEVTLVGLGFRLIKLGGFLLLKLGHSHYVKLPIPQSVHVVGYKKRLIIFGAHLGDINQFAEQLVRFRRPDVYKNKGVQLVGRVFRLKIGKQK